MRFSKRLFAVMLVVLLVFASAVPAVWAAGEASGQELVLVEEQSVSIRESSTPTADSLTQQMCCDLHFLLMLCALAVTVLFTSDRKRRQARQFELRSVFSEL